MDSGLRFGAAGMQGWRTGMEDSHLACLDLNGEAPPPAKDPPSKIAAFAVFDGHVRREREGKDFTAFRAFGCRFPVPDVVGLIVLNLGIALAFLVIGGCRRRCCLGDSDGNGPAGGVRV